MIDYKKIEKLGLITPGEYVLADLGIKGKIEALLLGYDKNFEWAAIEFKIQDSLFHDCISDEFNILRPACKGQGYFINIIYITLLPKRPRLGR